MPDADRPGGRSVQCTLIVRATALIRVVTGAVLQRLDQGSL
jgi:hypothetical protein